VADSGTAQVQGELWSARALDWAEVQEGMARPLYEAVLEGVDLGPDTALLDIGCGAGLFASLAAARAAEVHGLDAAPGLLAIARERVPQGEFQPGEIEELPYGERTFDVVTAFNSLQFANDPANAAREAARVAREDAPVVIAVWGEPQDSDAAGYLAAMATVMPPAPPGAPGPFALSEKAALEGLVDQAGLDLQLIEDVLTVWEYPDLAEALRGLLSAGPATRAIRHAGEPEVRRVATTALEPFRRSDGGYRLENVFRYAISTA
jgi:ubiquinone/menaquinone biosynthesis C-methylase UbiE